MILRRTSSSVKRGFSLVEVLIAIALVTIVGLGIILALMDGVYIQQSIRERNGATRVAADQIEEVKRELFARISPVQGRQVVIDDRGTETPDDDVVGTASLRFFMPDGTEVGTNANPVPEDGSMIVVESRVTWAPAGRLSSRQQTVVLTTTLAP